MSALVRTAVGSFRLEDAVKLEDLTSETLPGHLQSPLAAVADLPRIELGDAELAEIRHGRPIAMLPGGVPTAEAGWPDVGAPAEYAAISATGQLVAILFEKHPGQLWPARNFA
jgi:tRNA U55 pseudouridine synthase TruB